MVGLDCLGEAGPLTRTRTMNHYLRSLSAGGWLWAATLLSLAGSESCAGQGTLALFDAPASGAAIYDIDGATPLAGPAFLAQVYAAPVGDSLQPLGSPIPFATIRPGYFVGPTVPVPGTTPGGSAMVQVVAWRASDGATFALADHVGGHVGSSEVFEVFGLGNPNPPGNPVAAVMFGLHSFSLAVVVPEPSVLELTLAAATVLALGRGRRWFGPR